MLTRQGWSVVLLALGLIAAGRILSVFELSALGVAAGILVLGSAVWVASRRMNVRVNRQLQPSKVQVGATSSVTASVTNTGHRKSPVMYLLDQVGTEQSAVRCEIMPIPTGDNVRIVYRIPTSQRGIIAIGPMTLSVRDPFGIAAVKSPIFGVSELTVLPRIDRIQPPPSTLGHDPHGGLENPDALGRVGDEFYAMRPYEVGDDLRRVHWPSSAKRDIMMVRQDEQPWQGRSTVLLDVRHGKQVDEAFESCVSAAASVISAAFERGDLVRLTTTDGGDSGFGTGHAHMDAILEYLATAQLSRQASLQASLGVLSKRSNGGGLVVVTTKAPRQELQQIRRLQQTFGFVFVVDFIKPSWDGAADQVSSAPEPGIIHVPSRSSFAEQWNTALRTSTPRTERAMR
jgi:uncharacterized protein (DUF58 family)